jgi:multicomponent Na+:H+ antiporter subunit A
VLTLAEWVTRRTQTGSLRQYVRVALLALIVTSLYPLIRSFPMIDQLSSNWHWHEVLLVLLTLVGAAAAVFSRLRLSAIALLGIVGLLIAVLFALFSAPDLAITQIMVEALTVILLVLIFHRLPKFAGLRTRLARLADALVAVAAGAIMAGLALATAALHLPPTVSAQLARMSKPEANGRNIVNVILVDFRALDTLGEITVVAVAGLGVYALIKLRRRRTAQGGAP